MLIKTYRLITKRPAGTSWWIVKEDKDIRPLLKKRDELRGQGYITRIERI